MLRKFFFFQMRSCSRRCSCCCEGNVEVIGKVRSECKKNNTFASSIYFLRRDPVLGGAVVIVKVMLRKFFFSDEILFSAV